MVGDEDVQAGRALHFLVHRVQDGHGPLYRNLPRSGRVTSGGLRVFGRDGRRREDSAVSLLRLRTIPLVPPGA